MWSHLNLADHLRYGCSMWCARIRRRQAHRALARQLAYQESKACALRGHERDYIAAMMQSSQEVRAILESVRSIRPDARMLEVGSGAHGLIFFFGATRGVGVDPLAVPYATLFPAWQRRVPTVTAVGEALPFTDSSFDVVLCDNVVDHAERPMAITAEIARVLAPGGLLYFTVNIHHPIYAFASLIHATWNAVGVPYEIGPFADHTTHFTLAGARRLFVNLPLRILQETANIAETKAITKQSRPRNLNDWLKRFFFKNALFQVIAIHEPCAEALMAG